MVDYLGLAHDLKRALVTYTESGGTGSTAVDQSEAVAVMLERYEVCCDLFHGFDWAKWMSGTPQERLGLLPAAQEHILAQDSGKDRYVAAVRGLSQAFALAVPHEETKRIRDDVSFFQAVQSVLAQAGAGQGPGTGRPRPGRSSDRLQGRSRGRGAGHLRCGRATETRHLDPLRRVPRRSERDAPT